MKFLVGYDGSNEAEAALKEAQKHANVFKADIYIVTSLEQSSTLQKEEVEKAEGELEYLRTPFNIDDIPCETNRIRQLPVSRRRSHSICQRQQH